MSWNAVPINHNIADLMMEVEEQFGQVMNSFMEAGRTGDPLRYDRAVTRGISGFNKARDRCYTVAFRAFRHIDKNKVKRMEEMVKQETSRFCTNALKKVKERKKEKEKKHKEMMEEEEVTKHKRPLEQEQQY